MKRFKEFISELFNTSVSYSTYMNKPGTKAYSFSASGVFYLAAFSHFPRLAGESDALNFGFATFDEATSTVGESPLNISGAHAINVLNYALSIALDYIEKYNPPKIVMLANKTDAASRIRVYESMIRAFAPSQYGIRIKDVTYNGIAHRMYIFER
jgi:hypothetical protein